MKQHWEIEIGGSLPSDAFRPGKSPWVITFDPITHFQRKFVRKDLTSDWIRTE